MCQLLSRLASNRQLSTHSYTDGPGNVSDSVNRHKRKKDLWAGRRKTGMVGIGCEKGHNVRFTLPTL